MGHQRHHREFLQFQQSDFLLTLMTYVLTSGGEVRTKEVTVVPEMAGNGFWFWQGSSQVTHDGWTIKNLQETFTIFQTRSHKTWQGSPPPLSPAVQQAYQRHVDACAWLSLVQGTAWCVFSTYSCLQSIPAVSCVYWTCLPESQINTQGLHSLCLWSRILITSIPDCVILCTRTKWFRVLTVKWTPETPTVKSRRCLPVHNTHVDLYLYQISLGGNQISNVTDTNQMLSSVKSCT